MALRLRSGQAQNMNKKKEKPQKSSQFPKIYRFITEKIRNTEGDLRIMVIGFVFGAFLTLIVLCSFYLLTGLRERVEVANQRRAVISQIQYWENVVEKQKGYRDGYFMLAVLEYQIRDFGKSEEYLKKVLEIDPNFIPAHDLQKVLSRK